MSMSARRPRERMEHARSMVCLLCDAAGRTPVRIARNMVAPTDSREHLAWSVHDFRLSSLALEREDRVT